MKDSTRTCAREACEASFETRGTKRYCTPECRRAAAKCPDCTEARLAKGGMTRCKACNSANQLKVKYGISADRVAEMVEQQGGLCAICGLGRPLVVDHDHESGQFRGLLCRQCNAALGMFSDEAARIQAAADYLRKHGR